MDSERHPFGVVAEAVALLRDVSDTRPRKVISQQAGPVLSQHGQHLDPALGGLLGPTSRVWRSEDVKSPVNGAKNPAGSIDEFGLISEAKS